MFIRSTKTKKKSQAGTSLIEVLVSMVVAALGLLGMAKLQALALNQTNSADFQNTAAIAVDNISVIMKSNPVFWRDPAFPAPFDITINQNNATIIGGTGAGAWASTNKDCATASDCDTDEMASYDLRTMATDLSAATPGGSFRIQRDGVGVPPAFFVTARWNEKLMSLGGNSTKYGTGTVINQYRLRVQP